MRYFCGKSDTSVASDTSDTSNTGNSSDASKTSASVTRFSSDCYSFPTRQRSLDSFILLKFLLSQGG